MIQQTIFPFKIETTKERLTADGGLALMAEFNHGIGLRELTDRISFRVLGVIGVLILGDCGCSGVDVARGGRSLEDLRGAKK